MVLCLPSWYHCSSSWFQINQTQWTVSRPSSLYPSHLSVLSLYISLSLFQCHSYLSIDFLTYQSIYLSISITPFLLLSLGRPREERRGWLCISWWERSTLTPLTLWALNQWELWLSVGLHDLLRTVNECNCACYFRYRSSTCFCSNPIFPWRVLHIFFCVCVCCSRCWNQAKQLQYWFRILLMTACCGL